MKDKPILFSGEMVRAILDGRKTQTRRVVKPTKERNGSGCHLAPCEIAGDVNGGDYSLCPYGKPGDQLWVRETWRTDLGWNTCRPAAIAPGVPVDYLADGEDFRLVSGKSRPSIFMPRWASRITLEIVDVQVERLQDISEEDALAEGVHSDDDYPTESACPKCAGNGVHGGVGSSLGWIEVDCQECDTAVKRFCNLWQSINGAESWQSNPFVWVVEFKPIIANIDQIKTAA